MNKLLSMLGIVSPNTKDTKNKSSFGLFAWLRSGKSKLINNLEDNTFDLLLHLPKEVVEKYCKHYAYAINSDLTGFTISVGDTECSKVRHTSCEVFPTIEAVETEIARLKVERIREVIAVGVLTADEIATVFRQTTY